MLKTIIFDLDGTLWRTAESYVYAYRRLCRLYNVAPESIISDQTLLDNMGIKLSRFLPRLFPMEPDLDRLYSRAVAFSIEYLRANPEGSCYPGVQEVLQTLSGSYGIWLVSNSYDPYVEAFLDISGTRPFVAGYYTMQTGEKPAHLARILAEQGEKALYVGDDEEDYRAIADHENLLFCRAAYGIRSCPAWDYAIDALTELPKTVARIEEKERILAGRRHRILSWGANQLTLIDHPDGARFFGFVHRADGDFEHVVRALKEAAPGVIGPIDGNTYYPYRFAVDRFDWRLYPDCPGDPALLGAFLDNGFRIRQTYTSTLGRINPKILRFAEKTPLPAGFRAERLSGEEAFRRLRAVYEISLDAFAGADFYEPIPFGDFEALCRKNLSGLQPDLLLLYRADDPCAFCFCYEDPEKRFYVCKTTAIRRAFRGRRLILSLIGLSARMSADRGYDRVLFHFQSDRSRTLRAVYRDGVLQQKHYALLEYRNDT